MGTRRRVFSVGCLIGTAVALGYGCKADLQSASPNDGDLASASPSDAASHAALEQHRSAFQVTVPTAAARAAAKRGDAKGALATEKHAVLAEGVAVGIEAETSGPRTGWLKAHVTRAAAHPTEVSFAPHASAGFHLRDVDSDVAIRVSPRGANADAEARFADGYVVYPAGDAGKGDILHRVTPEGTEDFVVLDRAPRSPELAYDVELGEHVAGLRLVANTLELLDASGAPRLRVASPYVVGADGERRDATLSVSGCAVDTSPAAPWGRAVTPASGSDGGAVCTVHVAWDGKGLAYPAIVDPSWTATGAMLHPRTYISTVTLASGKVLAAGGTNYTGGATNATAELYDPTSGTWAATGSLTNKRDSYAITLLNTNKVLVTAGGSFNSAGTAYTATPTTELYDPTAGTWANGPSLGAGVFYLTSTLLPSGKVLVAGGLSSTDVPTTAAQVFDPTGNSGAGTFGSVLAMGKARGDHGAVLLQSGKVLITGGYSTTSAVESSAELFDPAGASGAGSFTNVAAAMLSKRADHGAALLSDGRVLLAGGWNQTSDVLTAEIFDPGANSGAGSFALTGHLVTSRSFFGMTALSNGKVLVAGGCNNQVCTGTLIGGAELFDPADNGAVGAFTATNAMISPRGAFGLSVLASGKVLAAGGYATTSTTSATSLAASEIYDVNGTSSASSSSGASSTTTTAATTTTNGATSSSSAATTTTTTAATTTTTTTTTHASSSASTSHAASSSSTGGGTTTTTTTTTGGSPTTTTTHTTTTATTGGDTGAGGDDGEGGGDDGNTTHPTKNCGCRTVGGDASDTTPGALMMLGLALAVKRRAAKRGVRTAR